MTKKIVVALGGNALGKTPEEQIKAVEKAAETIVSLANSGNKVIVGHGNGPQVGMIQLAMDYSANEGGGTPVMPLAECGAMSQGYIGYHIQQALQKVFREEGKQRDVVTVVTQVEVAADDTAFHKPSKPVGMFYTKEEAEKIEKEKGFDFVEDAGRGYRRVVPSPQPLDIVEVGSIEKMVENGVVVITVGGGGIPVIKDDKGYHGVDAVIDKDKSCSKLAEEVDADDLLILTEVEQVCIDFNKTTQKALSKMNKEEALKYIEEGQFAPGSMLPKVEACLQFVENKPSGTAIITSLFKAKEALEGKTGTHITLK